VRGAREEVGAGFVVDSRAAADATVLELRRIESPLEPGRYLLTVTVRDRLSGRVAQRSRYFEIGK
jgi:hypothetical protein